MAQGFELYTLDALTDDTGLHLRGTKRHDVRIELNIVGFPTPPREIIALPPQRPVVTRDGLPHTLCAHRQTVVCCDQLRLYRTSAAPRSAAHGNCQFGAEGNCGCNGSDDSVKGIRISAALYSSCLLKDTAYVSIYIDAPTTHISDVLVCCLVAACTSLVRYSTLRLCHDPSGQSRPGARVLHSAGSGT